MATYCSEALNSLPICSLRAEFICSLMIIVPPVTLLPFPLTREGSAGKLTPSRLHGTHRSGCPHRFYRHVNTYCHELSNYRKRCYNQTPSEAQRADEAKR